MTRNRKIALIAGALAMVGALAGGLWIIVFGGYIPQRNILIFGSMALAPLALAAAMVGYAVWWLVLFLLALACPDSDE